MTKHNQNPGGPADPNQGNQSGNQKGNSDKGGGDENIKALQKKLTERDKQIKDMQAKLEENNKNDGDDYDKKQLQKQIKEMNESIKQMQKEKREKELSEKYPDISSKLLIKFDDEQVEDIVKEQRKIAKNHYKGADILKKPQFKSASDVDKKIDAIKQDKVMSGMKKAGEIMKLKKIRNEFE